MVEIEVLGIPADCCKYKTKMSPRNALSPMWNDTFEIEVVQLFFESDKVFIIIRFGFLFIEELTEKLYSF